jgi:winged helix DNA-binding protein
MNTLTWRQVRARRLARHGLAAPLPGGPVEAVAAVAGTHAQVATASELAVGLRLDGVTRTDVRHALWTERGLIRTFGPRGTVHLLPTRDLQLWVDALSAVPWRNPVPDRVRMADEQTEAVLDAIEGALADAELTVDELTEAVVATVGSWAGDPVMDAFQGKWPRWRQVMHRAGIRGVLCFGPNRGRKVTYTDPRRWLPSLTPSREVDAAAPAELLRHYLHAFGPSTPDRFANWLAAPAAWARQVFADTPLDEVDVEGEHAWVVEGDTEAPESPPRGLRLLPYFDAYAYSVGNDKARLYPGVAARRAAGNFQVLLVDGVVGGLWHQRRSGRRVTITVEPFGSLTTRRRRELDEQVERVGAILEATPEVTIGEVTVGGHA